MPAASMRIESICPLGEIATALLRDAAADVRPLYAQEPTLPRIAG